MNAGGGAEDGSELALVAKLTPLHCSDLSPVFLSTGLLNRRDPSY
jgi:hypothetical protein